MSMPPQAPKPQPLEGIRHIIAVSSGKGGVGKTTVSVNLAVSLVNQGSAIGLLDADIYGPNVPMMMGVKDEPGLDNGKITPLESHGVKFMSLGLLSREDTPVIWRGPMLAKMISM